MTTNKTIIKRKRKRRVTASENQMLSEKANSKPEITAASDWKTIEKKETIIELTSGNTVRVKELDLMQLVFVGHIDTPILNTFMKIKGKINSDSPFENLGPKELGNMDELFKSVALEAIIDPKVSKNGEEGTVNINDISFNDLSIIMNVALKQEGGAGKLAKFHSG